MNSAPSPPGDFVCIVDPSPIFASGLRQLAEAESGQDRPVVTVTPESLARHFPVFLADGTLPSVVIMDACIHDDFDSFEWIARIREAAPTCAFVVVLRVLDYFLLTKAIASEISVMVSRDDPCPVFRHAYQAAVMRGSFLSHSVTRKIGTTLQQEKWLNQSPLSGREMDVLIRLGVGRAASEIADEFQLSPKTVGTYRTRLLKKLGLRTNADISFFCLKHFPKLVHTSLGLEPLAMDDTPSPRERIEEHLHSPNENDIALSG
ncbi:MAG: response regulator transcription factor [Verrucomicrobiaceae bacterium]|nr:response regulator transcription factor [Verrucomicrobiaceae bacterium]